MHGSPLWSRGLGLSTSNSGCAGPISGQGTSRSVVSFRPCGLQPTRLLFPWDSPGKNTGVGSLSFLQGIFPTQGLNPGLPHCRQFLYRLCHRGSPRSHMPWDQKKKKILFNLKKKKQTSTPRGSHCSGNRRDCGGVSNGTPLLWPALRRRKEVSV